MPQKQATELLGRRFIDGHTPNDLSSPCSSCAVFPLTCFALISGNFSGRGKACRGHSNLITCYPTCNAGRTERQGHRDGGSSHAPAAFPVNPGSTCLVL